MASWHASGGGPGTRAGGPAPGKHMFRTEEGTKFIKHNYFESFSSSIWRSNGFSNPILIFSRVFPVNFPIISFGATVRALFDHIRNKRATLRTRPNVSSDPAVGALDSMKHRTTPRAKPLSKGCQFHPFTAFTSFLSFSDVILMDPFSPHA